MLRWIALALLSMGLACAGGGPREIAPLATRPVKPSAGERIVVDHVYLVIDASASVDVEFEGVKALVRSFVKAMPDGSYQSGSVAFGGYDRATRSLALFDRSDAIESARHLELLREGTPLDRVLAEVSDDLVGKRGRAAIVLFSDGVPTDPVGRDLEDQRVLDAAVQLTERYDGEVCFHAVQVGTNPRGAALLSTLAAATPCGSSRAATSIQNLAALEGFGGQVFLGATQTRSVAAAPPDSDRDGVIDGRDQCPGTPLGAEVDPRGCWTVDRLGFAFDSDEIEPRDLAALDELGRVLQRNPNLRVRIEGHTDSVGSVAHNQALSERRAAAVRRHLVDVSGVAASRIQIWGYGATRPAYPNDTAEGRRGNRRTEITPL
jgi:OOP family OmpA-OmpF porin